MTDTTAGEGEIERLCAAMLDGVGCTPWHSGAWDSDGTEGASRQGVRDSVRRILSALAAQPSAGAQGEADDDMSDASMVALILRDTLSVGRGTTDGDPVSFIEGIEEAADCISARVATTAQPDTGDVAALREALEGVLDLFPGEDCYLCCSGDYQVKQVTKARAVLAALSKPNAPGAASFQARVLPWLIECFGADIAGNIEERCDRFIEEALEQVQSLHWPRERALALVDYVYGRPIGEPHQEAGGVMVTFAALCQASGLDMQKAGDDELARIMRPEIVQKIRAKQAAKPTGSALPIATTPEDGGA